MVTERSKNSMLLCVFIAVLFSQNLVIPVISRSSFADEKNFFPFCSTCDGGTPPSISSPPIDPGLGGTPPSGHGSSGSPPHRHHGHHRSPPHGSSNCGTPPSHGGGGSYDPTPSTPSTPTYTPTPTTPSTPTYTPTPTTPSTPTYTPTPTTPDILTPPSIDPNTPTTPTFPGIFTPPSSSFPPLLPDPNSPTPLFPGTCTYWSTHPNAIWGLLGWWGTMGDLFHLPSSFGTSSSFPGAGLTLPQALSNTRQDGLGSLYREGAASFLNSMANPRFPYSTQQVRDQFTAALVSNRAADAQANLFRQANEGRVKPRA
ncbi:hypothetical protein AQUCO_05500131v1 [Aquilegia coerulea]|uniref:Uncharacterized protein n=1 Tax=Aquilegia coerulea TaxID=218851 RepID=A0A2G5CH71_AQUCA|nr:hypothetical protein AQUCO_05500131v1 [Aquilegia coerulea]